MGECINHKMQLKPPPYFVWLKVYLFFNELKKSSNLLFISAFVKTICIFKYWTLLEWLISQSGNVKWMNFEYFMSIAMKWKLKSKQCCTLTNIGYLHGNIFNDCINFKRNSVIENRDCNPYKRLDWIHPCLVSYWSWD